MKYAHVMLEFGKVRIEICDMYVFMYNNNNNNNNNNNKTE